MLDPTLVHHHFIHFWASQLCTSFVLRAGHHSATVWLKILSYIGNDVHTAVLLYNVYTMLCNIHCYNVYTMLCNIHCYNVYTMLCNIHCYNAEDTGYSV